MRCETCTSTRTSSYLSKGKGSFATLQETATMLRYPSLSLSNCSPEALSATALCLANLFLGSGISLSTDEPFHALVGSLGKPLAVRVVELAFLFLHKRTASNTALNMDWASQADVECGKYVGKGQIPPPSSTTTAAASLCSVTSFENEDAESYHSVSSSDGFGIGDNTNRSNNHNNHNHNYNNNNNNNNNSSIGSNSPQTLASPASANSRHTSPSSSTCPNRFGQTKDAKELFVGTLSPTWQYVQVADGTTISRRLRCAVHCEGLAISTLPFTANNFSRFC